MGVFTFGRRVSTFDYSNNKVIALWIIALSRMGARLWSEHFIE